MKNQPIDLVAQTCEEEGVALIKMATMKEAVTSWRVADTLEVLNATIEKLTWLREKLIAVQATNLKKKKEAE